jgi:hypothetical protein
MRYVMLSANQHRCSSLSLSLCACMYSHRTRSVRGGEVVLGVWAHSDCAPVAGGVRPTGREWLLHPTHSNCPLSFLHILRWRRRRRRQWRSELVPALPARPHSTTGRGQECCRSLSLRLPLYPLHHHHFRFLAAQPITITATHSASATSQQKQLGTHHMCSFALTFNAY